MSSFRTAKATHIFSAKKFQHICVSLDVNFNESLTNNVVSFEQLGPDIFSLIGSGVEDQISEIIIFKLLLHIPVALCLSHSRKENLCFWLTGR